MITKPIIIRLFFLFLLQLFQVNASEQDHRILKDCRLPTNYLAVNKFQPLILRIVSQSHSYDQSIQFQYPSSKDYDSFVLVTEETRLVCANGSIAINSRVLSEDMRSVSVQCGVTSFQVTQEDLASAPGYYYRQNPKPRCITSANTFAEIGCTTSQLPEAYIVSNRSKYCQSKIYKTCVEIGYQLNNRFLPTIEFITVDETKLQPLMSHVTIPPVIGNRQTGRYAWKMRRGPIFGTVPARIEELYQRDYQRRRFHEIFRNRQLVDFYIPENGDMYLTEGQLTSEHDFFYKSQQGSAFFYENIVPIWQTIARGNWELAGEFVRKLATKTTAGLKVWSGTIEHLVLPDLYGDEKPIFLLEGHNGEQLVPVPELLYKYVIDYHGIHGPRGLMLITVNDPRGTHFVNYKRHHICNPKQICHSLQPEFAGTRRGYTYCCTLEDVCSIAKKLDLPVFSTEVEMLL